MDATIQTVNVKTVIAEVIVLAERKFNKIERSLIRPFLFFRNYHLHTILQRTILFLEVLAKID